MQQDRIPLGTAFMLGFCLTAPLIDVCAKLAAATLPVAEITLARFVVQALLMAPIVAAMGQSFRLRDRALRLTVVRAAVSILSTYAFVAAVRAMPIADALALVFVEPFIILFLGWALFGEQVGPRRVTAAAVGFGGALMVIRPSFAAFGAVAFFPLATAVGFALYILVTRRLAPLQHPAQMQFHTALTAVVLWLPLMALGGTLGLPDMELVLPSGLAWGWLAGVGAAATLSHMLMSYGLRFAPAATLAPLHYLEIVSSATLGYLVFGNFPDAPTWAGIAVIAASGLYIINRERVIARGTATGSGTASDAGSASGRTSATTTLTAPAPAPAPAPLP